MEVVVGLVVAVMFVGACVCGVLIARKNPKGVEAAVQEVKVEVKKVEDKQG